jgi:hypothetical protein
VAGGQLTSGKPVAATMATSGQQVQYTFAATAKQNVTFNATHFDFTDHGLVDILLEFYEPGSNSIYTTCAFSGNSFCNFTTPVSGTWKAVLVPNGETAGSLTLTFADNVPTQVLTPGTPVTTALKYQGQEAGYTFAATAGKSATFDVTHFDVTDNGPVEVFLEFFEPGSNSADATCAVTGNTECLVKTPVGGTWSFALVPYGATAGSLTLTLK